MIDIFQFLMSFLISALRKPRTAARYELPGTRAELELPSRRPAWTLVKVPLGNFGISGSCGSFLSSLCPTFVGL